jgi:hypothetical protein
MLVQNTGVKAAKRRGDGVDIQLQRWSNQTKDLALPLPPAVLQHLRISGPCALTAKRMGQTLILKKKGSPLAWRIRIPATAV